MDINTCFATTESYRNLALYAHLIPSLAIFILGCFAYQKAENRHKAEYFFAFVVGFALWLIGDLILWTSDSYHLVAAVWQAMDYIEITFFLLLFGFVSDDLFPANVRRWVSPAIVISIAVPLVITVTGNAVTGFNQPQCEMLNNRLIEDYKLALEAIILAATFLFGLIKVFRTHRDRRERVRIGFVVAPIVLFMGIFAGSEYISSYTGVYEIELYSFFSLPVFILLLTIAITSYGTFKLGSTAVKALFYVFLALAGTQFFSVQSTTDFVLTAISFGVVLTLGIMLFRVSEREIAQRELIQKQEQELEVVNHQQEGLLHFISHEIKGYLTKNEAGFAAITEGDYGAVSEPLKTMAASALVDTRKGVETVMDILDASNLKKGTVAYDKKPFNFSVAVQDVVNSLKPMAQEKGISLEYTDNTDGPATVNGDENKLRRHVIRNVIDNSIKYTPSGSVHVELSKTAGILRMTITDTGVGITAEDMKRLFTEGGHGADSIKVNVHSTGYGLYIAKSITEAHGGKIWAESEGKDRGSRFITELPTD
ncbi:MAG: HAMP domain-containing sensor histidine kinase [bacterium]|nr:HAMP domain-containing sensor histidine kinase [bacterium]